MQDSLESQALASPSATGMSRDLDEYIVSIADEVVSFIIMSYIPGLFTAGPPPFIHINFAYDAASKHLRRRFDPQFARVTSLSQLDYWVTGVTGSRDHQTRRIWELEVREDARKRATAKPGAKWQARIRLIFTAVPVLVRSKASPERG